jgi:1-acyl-sn-glycerol-3-phosphate acyltransferase
MLEPLISATLTTGTRLLTGAQSRWVGCGPMNVQRIYFANHTSHLDFVLLWTALPQKLRRRTRPVAAADYWNAGAIRRYLINRVFRGVMVDRTVHNRSDNPLAPMLNALEAGDSLIFFPEGTRGSGGELLPFKSGIYNLARACSAVELVPVWMDNSYRVMPKGSMLPVPLLCSVTFGKPTKLEPDEDKSDFLDRLRLRLMETGKE